MPTQSRHTSQRQRVLLAVKSSGKPLNAQEVYAAVRCSLPGIGYATVYRNLNVLGQRGEIAALEDEKGIKRFVGHAYHEVLFCCQRCNRIERINAQLLLHDERALSKNRKVLSMRLTAYGLCSQCSIKLQGL